MRWITRKQVKVDRIACAWVVIRFVDPNAEFHFVPESDLVAEATARSATAFDAPRIAAVILNHRPGKCTFDAVMEDYDLRFNGLADLATIVRAADGVIPIDFDSRARALKGITDSLHALQLSDDVRLKAGFPIFDALFEDCKH
jgi:hypothetical protein